MVNENQKTVSECSPRTTPHPNSPETSLILELASITEPIPLNRIFPRPQPVEVDLGCGDGDFLLKYAALHPERNFIGVERLLGRLKKLDKKGRRAGLENIRGVLIECGYFVHYLLPPSSIHALHIYFPDPWPKKKHKKHRLINETFPTAAARVLVPGGRVYVRTDHDEYFQQILEVFGADRRFVPVETPQELLAVPTEFQIEFESKGLAIHHAAFELRR